MLATIMKNVQNDIVYSRDVVEFVTVAAEFCAYLEQSEGRPREEFVSTLLKLLPFLYLKATLLPKVETDDDCYPEELVSEADYEWIRATVASIMEADDEFLELSGIGMMQTDETRLQTISENMADVYQAVRNFVGTYKNGVESIMREALWTVVDSFELYWGERIVDTLRVLHRVRYAANGMDYDDM